MSDRTVPLNLPIDLLTGAAVRLVADHAETQGLSEAEAAAAILNAAGLERRRAVLDWFAGQWSDQPGSDSVEMLREMRRGR